MIYREAVEGEKYPKKYYTDEGQPYFNESMDINNFDDCVCVLDKDVIVVDIDEFNDKELLAKMFEFYPELNTYYTETKRGFHLYYKKYKGQRINAKQGICLMGFNIEIKQEQVSEKRNGVANVIHEHNITLFPKNLLTIIKNTPYQSLYNLDEGARDNTMFEHSRKIFAHGLNSNEVFDILTFANKNLLLYPLDDVQKFSDKTLKQKDMNKTTMNERCYDAINKFGMYNYDNILYARKPNGQYTGDYVYVKRLIAKEYDDLSSANVSEVMELCKLKADYIEGTKFPINFINGHFFDGVVYPYQYTGFTPFYIDINYNEQAPVDDTVEKLLEHLSGGDLEYRNYLLEILGYCLIYDFEVKQLHSIIPFIVGNGENGKGTLIRLLTATLGKDNVAFCSLDQLKDEQKLMSCKNKLLNIGDDIEDKPINDKVMTNLKSISSCDSINIRQIYESAKDTVVGCALLFTSNHILKSFEKGHSWKRRCKWLPAYKQITDKDSKFITKLTSIQAKEYFFSLLIKSAINVYHEGFSECGIVNDFNRDYQKINSLPLAFCEFMDTLCKEDNNDEITDSIALQMLYNNHHEYGLWCVGATANHVKEACEDYQELFMENSKVSIKQLKQTLCERYNVSIQRKQLEGERRHVFFYNEGEVYDFE